MGNYLVFHQVRDPGGRTMFASIVPRLDVGPLDPGAALELSGLSRAHVFREKLYAFDGETGTVTRYRIQRDGLLVVDLLEDGALAAFSMSQLGITRFADLVVFVDETRAFYVNHLFEDLVVEWNPSTMTITGSFPAGLTREGFDANAGGFVVRARKVVIPLSWTSFVTASYRPVAAVAVLDLDDPGAIRVIEDERCIGSARVIVAGDGGLRVVNDNVGGLADVLAEPDAEVPPPCLLPFDPELETFGPDPPVNLRELTGAPLVADAVSAADGTFVTFTFVSDVDPKALDPLELLDGPYWRPAVVDLQRGRVEPVVSLPPSGSTPSAGSWMVTTSSRATTRPRVGRHSDGSTAAAPLVKTSSS